MMIERIEKEMNTLSSQIKMSTNERHKQINDVLKDPVVKQLMISSMEQLDTVFSKKKGKKMNELR